MVATTRPKSTCRKCKRHVHAGLCARAVDANRWPPRSPGGAAGALPGRWGGRGAKCRARGGARAASEASPPGARSRRPATPAVFSPLFFRTPAAPPSPRRSRGRWRSAGRADPCESLRPKARFQAGAEPPGHGLGDGVGPETSNYRNGLPLWRLSDCFVCLILLRLTAILCNVCRGEFVMLLISKAFFHSSCCRQIRQSGCSFIALLLR